MKKMFSLSIDMIRPSKKYSHLDAIFVKFIYVIWVISNGGIFLHYGNINRTYKYFAENVVTDICT
jgi:hypothetical protein